MRLPTLLSIFFISLFLISLASAVTVTTNSTQIGQIRSDFYGTSLTSIAFFSGASSVDTDNNGVIDTLTNSTWHREKFLASGMKEFRLDTATESRYSNQTPRTDGVNFTYTSLSNFTDMMNWVKTNNLKVLWVADYMPTWLADNSSGKCSNLNFCPPTNATIFGNLIVDWINRIGCTTDSCEIEVWNEPYGGFWMGTDTYDSINKAKNYSAFYDTVYNVIKANNSAWQVGGPAGFRLAPNMTQTFLTNESGKFDFISIHPYGYLRANGLEQLIDIQNLKANCTTLGISCNRIIASEWNVGDPDLTNTTSLSSTYGASIGQSYVSLLNYLPNNISLDYHLWSTRYDFGSFTPDYPYRYEMLSEPQVNNTIFIPYNITKSFANNHKAGNTVYNSTSTDSGVKVVVSKDSDQTFITLINTNSTAQTINLNLNAVGTIGYLKDYETNQVYNQNTPITLQSNDVKTLYEVLGSTSGDAITISNSPSGDITIADHDVEINNTINSENSPQYICTTLNGVQTCQLDPSLIASWNFDNNSNIGDNSTYFVDNIGTYNLSLNTSLFSYVNITNGKINKGIQLNGTNYLDTPATFNTSRLINGGSWGGWFYINSTTGRQTIIEQRNSVFAEYVESGNKLVCTVRNETTNTAHSVVMAVSYTANTWHQFYCIFNGTSITSSFDGVMATNSTTLIGQLRSLNNYVRVGSDGTSLTQNFTGSLDELRIWNRSLSANEVYGLYTSSLNKFNATQQILYTNYTINNLTQSFNVFANDTLNNNFTSNLQNIHRKQNIDLSTNLLGTTNIYTYGVNTQGWWFGNNTAINTDSDATLEVLSNNTWHREKFQESHMKFSRADFGLSTVSLSYGVFDNRSAIGWSNNGDIYSKKEYVRNAYVNGDKVLFSVGYMPKWLANVTSDCATNNATCGASNWTQWRETVVQAINLTCTPYPNTCLFEVWNEPERNFLNSNTTYGSQTKIDLYMKLYNETYWAIKDYNSSLKVYAPVVSLLYDGIPYPFLNQFLGNYSNQMDGLSIHDYILSNETPEHQLNNDLTQIYSLCTSYSVDCNQIFISELNILNTTVKNTSTLSSVYSNDISRYYSYILNNYPSNISMIPYQWSAYTSYFTNNQTNLYPEYPSKWNMVSEPLLDNELTPLYNITKDFATYCPSGWSVYNTSNDYNSGIVQVYCTDGTNKGIITTNIENNQQNITINGLSANELLIDVNTKTLYNANSSGSLTYGVLDNYSVNPLTNPYHYRVNGDWQWFNYLNESLRDMTAEEIATYTTSEEQTTASSNNMCYQFTTGLANAFLYVMIALGIVAVIVIVGLLGYLDLSAIGINFNSDGSNNVPYLILFIGGIGVLIIGAITTIVVISFICPLA